MTIPPGHDAATCVCPDCVAHRRRATKSLGFPPRPASLGGLLLVAAIVLIAIAMERLVGA